MPSISYSFIAIMAFGMALALSTTDVRATTIVVQTETGNAMETEFGFRSDTNTRGYDLAGAKVTATFDDGTTEMRTWQVFDPFTTGGVNGDRWSLFQDELGNVSLVSDNRVMTSFLVDLTTSMSVTPATPDDPEVIAGASVFDISRANDFWGQDGSTPGTGYGFAFSFAPFNAPDGEVTVTYSGAVNIKGAPAVGDLFTTMFVDLTGLVGGGFTGNAVYTSDQDTLRVAGDLTPVGATPVPLPAGLPLLLAGLGGLAVFKRRYR